MATVGFAQTDFDAALVGTWEYRQAAGKDVDAEGERLEVARVDGRLQGVYFGLEREGEHGLFYTAVPMRNLKVGRSGEVSFTVPARDLFSTRPRTLQQAETEKSRSSGFTRDELSLEGVLQGDRLTLRCVSTRPSCPDRAMVFQKGQRRPGR